MLTTLGIALWFRNSALRPVLTYRNPAAPVSVILRDLSQELRRPLTADATTAREVLCLRLTQTPSEDVLRDIAWAVGGSWEKRGEGFCLTRSPVDLAEERLAVRNDDISCYRAFLNAHRATLTAPALSDDASSRKLVEDLARDAKVATAKRTQNLKSRETLRRSTPAGRFLQSLMASFRPEDLADLPTDRPVVFSTSPTTAQRTFPFSIARPLEQLKASLPVWKDAVTASRGQDALLTGVRELDSPLNASQLGPMLLSVRRVSHLFVQFELRVYSRSGQRLLSLEDNFRPAQLDAALVTGPERPYFELPEVTVQILEAARAGRPVPPPWPDVLRHPTSADPLAPTLGEVWLALAQAESRDLVANLSDGDLILTSLLRTSGWGRRQTIDLLRLTSTFESLPSRWRMRPAHPVDARRQRASRPDLEAWLAYLVQNPLPRIDPDARWEARLPEQLELTSALTQLLHLPPRRRSAWLRFYGTLTDSQRRVARDKGFPLRDLSPAQLDAIVRIGLGESFGLEMDPKLHGPDRNEYHREFTVTVSDQSLKEANLLIQDRSEEILLVPPANSSSQDPPAEWDLESYAWILFAERHPGVVGSHSSHIEKVGLSTTRRRTVQIKVLVAPGTWLEGELTEIDPPTGPFDLQSLPKPLQRRLSDKLRELENTYPTEDSPIPFLTSPANP